MPEITDETGLTRTEQENARKKLVRLGLLEEQRRGTPAKLWFRLNKDALYELLAHYLANKDDGNPQSSLRETCKQECSKPAGKTAENPQTLKEEITAEITTQITAAEEIPPSGVAADSTVLSESVSEQHQNLERQLIDNGVNRKEAVRLVAAYTEECRRQLTYLPFVTRFRSTRGAYLRSAIEQGFGAPKAYLQEQERVEAARKAEASHRAARERKAQQEAQRQEVLQYLGHQLELLKAEAPACYSDFEQEFQRRKAEQLKAFAGSKVRDRLESIYSSNERRMEAFLDYLAIRPCPLPDLAAWLAQHPVERVKELFSFSRQSISRGDQEL
ncbi:MAG: hypothetical protein IT209_11895 [Armatimonadetes bacterium]|nr:hypothetical protein [Armatimonadota bacterium]